MRASDHDCTAFLARLCELSRGETARRFVIGRVSVGLGMEEERLRDAIRRLELYGYINVSRIVRTIPACVEITAEGVESVRAGARRR